MPIQKAPNEKELEKLIAIFLRAETAIINEIGRLRSQGLVDYHAVAALNRIQAILKQMETDCWEYVPKMVEQQFYVRVPEARKILEPVEKHVRGYENAEALTATQYSIMDRLVTNLMGEIVEASGTAQNTLQNAFIGRTQGDIFRRVTLGTLAQTQAMGKGTQKAANDIFQTLTREGVTAFIDKAGRRWSLHTYCSMVARTTSRQAEVLATLTADEEHDLYKISSHGTTCKICAPLEGRVYSKSGKDPVFPPLASAFGKIDPTGPNDLTNSYLNIHPNCLHVLTPWTPAGRSEEEIQKIKDFSSFKKNPPAIDPRTQKQIDTYRKKETARADWLRDYRQWETYRMTLGDQVPKTFETFRKHKRLGDEKYRIWKLDVMRRNDLLNHPDKALPHAETATAAEAKFTKYFFHPESKDGYPKGLSFQSRLGYNIENWEEMREEILKAAKKYPATHRNSDRYGDRYSQLVILQGKKGTPANVLLAWNVTPEGETRLTTAHMEEI